MDFMERMERGFRSTTPDMGAAKKEAGICIQLAAGKVRKSHGL